MAKKSKWYTDLLNQALAVDTPQLRILEHRINEHLKSEEVKTMVRAQEYHQNKTAIQNKTTKLKHRSNTKLELGLFKKLVRQKVGYLLSKAPSVTAEDDFTQKYLNEEVFDRKTLKEIKALGQEAIIKGIAYSQIYIDENGKLRLFKIPSEQVVVFWADERREEAEAFGRINTVEIWENGLLTERKQFAYFDENGVTYYLINAAGRLEADPRYKETQSHFYYFNHEDEQPEGMNWTKAPIIAWRYNEDEQSLLHQVESLIDDISVQASTASDLLADVPNFIYILRDYDGQDLDEFMGALNEHMAVKVAGTGGVDKLSAGIDTTAVENTISRNRMAVYEAGAGIDTQDENLGNASGQALKWRYTDLDLDMNDMEAELHSSIEQLLWFVENYAKSNGQELNLTGFEYVFNRDMITNETEAIENVTKSIGVIDDKTLREQHPWYTDKVEKRLEEQRGESKIPPRPQYSQVFKQKEVTPDGETN